MNTDDLLIKQLLMNFKELLPCRDDIINACKMMVECYEKKGKILICGNGGSAADAEHITGELMKGFLLKRPVEDEYRKTLESMYPDGGYMADHLQGALPAISLGCHMSLITAFTNDVAADMVFAQQVFGYGVKGDLLMGLSTSGNSGNVVNAVKIAKSLGLSTLCITGQRGGALKELCDGCIAVPSDETYRVQEFTLPVYHTLCAMVEQHFFG